MVKQITIAIIELNEITKEYNVRLNKNYTLEQLLNIIINQ